MAATGTSRPRKRKRTGVRRKTSPAEKATRHPPSAARKSKSVRRSVTPRADRHADFIDAAARVLDLTIEPAWKEAVAANLAATLRLAGSFMEFPLPDEAEPASIFVA
jgi:hypothetical protein